MVGAHDGEELIAWAANRNACDGGWCPPVPLERVSHCPAGFTVGPAFYTWASEAHLRPRGFV